MILEKIKEKVNKLSSSPGIYIFKDKSGQILYVGKATNLKSRVNSYFGNSGIPIRPIEAMIGKVEDIDYQETDSVLEAVFLESQMIKKLQPKYNAMGKDDKTFAYIALTKEKFPRFIILRETEMHGISNSKTLKAISYKLKTSYGPYASKKQIEIALKILRRIFPYHNSPKESEKGCLDFQIGLCPGPYAGAISKEDYQKNIRGIRLILEGKKKSLVKKMEKEMQEYAKKHEFEKAAVIRNKIFALKHIQDVALVSNEKPEFSNYKSENNLKFRLEAYDISNISGKYATGSMVVFTLPYNSVNGIDIDESEPDKKEYRKFKIKTVTGTNDVGMMAEVLFRRFRNNWPKPDLIILDGGQGYLNMGQKILRELNLKIPIVAVAKGPSRKNLEVFGQMLVVNKEIINILKDKNLLKQITDEAHRFAIVYHRKVRHREISV